MGLVRRRRPVRKLHKLRRIALLGGAVAALVAWRERQFARNEGRSAAR